MLSLDYEAYLKSREWRERCTLKMLLDGQVEDATARRSLMVEVINHVQLPRTWRADYQLWLDRGRPFTVCCEDCSQRVPRWLVNCHHLDYKHLFKERREDLVVLCEACHCKRHGLPEPDWWSLVPEWQEYGGRVRPFSAVAIEVWKDMEKNKPAWLAERAE